MSAGSFSDLLVAIGKIESGNNYSWVSPPGYLGYYQLAEESLQAAGFYNGDSTTALDFIGSWTAKAASYGVTDKASFLASPAAQDAAEHAWFDRIDQDINTLGLGKYEGQTLNGLTLTTARLFAGANLVGVWGLKSYLESGGDHVSLDGSGNTITHYMSLIDDYATPYSFDHSAGVALSGGSGPDGLHGWGGNDTLNGGGGANSLFGGDGADSITGGSGADTVNGNQGADTIDAGAGGADWLMGGQGGDLITIHASATANGNLGDDTLNGGSGACVLRGGQGSDLIVGGGSGDQLFGDRGDDTLTGGRGADVFHFVAGGGHDVITDFNLAEGDRLRIDEGAHYSVAQVGADTVVTLDGGDQITLQGVSKAALADGWIV